jgi:hypothetical protein
MLKILGENYYLDLDAIDEYVKLPSSSTTESHLNVMKYEMVKIMTEVLLTEKDDVDETLGQKSTLSIPFKFAFNSMINKKLINKY